MKKYNYTVCGGATAVRLHKVAEMPQAGKSVWTLNGNDCNFDGGVGFNIASALAKFGCRLYPVLWYSSLEVKQTLDRFCAQYGFPDDGAQKPVNNKERLCTMYCDPRKCHMTVIHEWDSPAFSALPVTEISPRYFTDSDMAVVCGIPGNEVDALYSALECTEIPVALSYRDDRSMFPPEQLSRIVGRAKLLFLNDSEAESLSAQFGMSHITELFQKYDTEQIAVTCGKQGSVLYVRAEDGFVTLVVPVTENEIGNVDPTGAGDSFIAGFLYGYANGKPPAVCAQYGSTAASFVIEKEGSVTNIPGIEQLLARNSLRPDAE